MQIKRTTAAGRLHGSSIESYDLNRAIIATAHGNTRFHKLENYIRSIRGVLHVMQCNVALSVSSRCLVKHANPLMRVSLPQIHNICTVHSII